MNPLGTVRLCTRQISSTPLLPPPRFSQSRLFRLFRIKSDIYVFTLAVPRECLKRILKRNITRTRRNREARPVFYCRATFG